MLAEAAAYPYLASSLFLSGLVLLLAWALLSRPMRRLTILGGVIQAPAGVLLIFLEGGYWRPVRRGGAVPGVEDALISFAVAGLAWLLAALVSGQRLEFRYDIRRSLVRWIAAGAGCGACFLAGVAAGLDGMTSILLAYLLAAPVLTRLNRGIGRLALLGVPLYLAVWIGVVEAVFGFFPEFRLQWNPVGPWGALVAGVPLGELAWAAAYGAFSPLFTAFVFEVRPCKARALNPTSAGATGVLELGPPPLES